MKILVATHNRGKLREYAELLADLSSAGQSLEWVSLPDMGITTEVEETGQTFEENAVLKAVAYARTSGLITLADDSGLEVKALNGEPGIFSARYGGPGLDEVGRYRLLLERLKDVPDERRAARFVCVIAVATPDGRVQTATGIVEGRIAHDPRGNNGFGYDPVFFVEEWGKRMAELPSEVKNRISHRARALEALKPLLAALIG